LDNRFVERLWRPVKCETLSLHKPADGFQARRVIGDWIDFSSSERPHHSAWAGRAPGPSSPRTQQHRQNIMSRALAA
jgi:hypothetical protein